MRFTLFFILIASMLTSCDKPITKKIMLISNPGTVVDLDAKTITLTQTTAYEFKEYSIKDEGPVSFSVKSPEGEYKLELSQNGCYLLNTKFNDTIVGSYQDYVAPKQDYTLLSQETLKQKTDSLIDLMVGKNVSDDKGNYFIPAKTARYITENMDAIFIAPYHSKKSLEVTKGTIPEVYRFYTNKEIGEMVAKMKELAAPVKATSNP